MPPALFGFAAWRRCTVGIIRMPFSLDQKLRIFLVDYPKSSGRNTVRQPFSLSVEYVMLCGF